MKKLFSRLFLALVVCLVFGTSNAWSAFTYHFVGENNGWKTNQYYVTVSGPGSYEIKVPMISSGVEGEFLILRTGGEPGNNWDDKHYKYWGGSYITASPGQAVNNQNTTANTGSNIRLTQTLYNVTITLTVENEYSSIGDNISHIDITGSLTDPNEKKSYSIYYDNSSTKWNKVYLYTWNGIDLGNFPGKQITETNSNGYFVYTYEGTSEPTNVSLIWSDGSNSNDADKKSENLKWETNKVYKVEGKVDGIYMIGNVNDGTWSPDNGFLLEKNGNTYKAENVKLGTSYGDAYFSFCEKLSANKKWEELGQRYGANEYDNYDPGLNTVDGVVNNFSLKKGENAIKVDAGIYDVEVNLSDNTCNLTCKEVFKPSSYKYPDYIYLIGDIKGDTWEKADEYKVAGNNGIYEFKSVSIYSGNEDKPNENYFSFFGGEKKVNSDGSFDYEKLLPRFVCDPTEINEGSSNVLIHDEDLDNAAEDGVVKKLLPHMYNRNPDREFNFKVYQGYYDITLDLTTWEIKIKRHTPVVFDWHDHDNKVLPEENQDEHEIAFGPNAKIQVGVEGDAKHDAANKAQYEVYWRALPTSASGIKARRAGENDGSSNERMTEITDPQGDKVTGNPEYYTVDNKAVITFNKTGIYEIEASVPDRYEEIYPEATGNAIVLTVNQGTLTLEDASAEIPSGLFNNAKNGKESVVGVFKTSDGTQLAQGTDFTVSIAPKDKEGDNWTVADNEEEALKLFQALPGYSEVESQATSLYSQYLETSANNKVDGIYTQVNDLTATYNDGAYDIEGVFPCSGSYLLTVSSVASSNYTFETYTREIHILPNLYAVYANESNDGKPYDIPGFNINGFGFKNDDASVKVIEYKANEDGVTAWEPTDSKNRPISFAYTPGLFFATSLTIDIPKDGEDVDNTPDNVLGLKRKAGAQEEDNIYYGSNISLAGVTGGTLNVTAVKNGASATQYFELKVKSDAQDPLAVETVEAAEDGVVEYFNLQGVKVANPEHGIYIKVQNGKATKVMVK